MARFLTAPRRQMVNPYPEVNVDFYSNLMNQTQQNLNQAAQMQSQALDYIYNLPVYSEEDRASVITPAEEKFKSMLDSEFISSSQVAGTIMDVRREIQPGVQALQAKSKAAEMYDKLKVQYGVNALMGTDPRSLSIKTQEGNWRDPSQFKASGVNMEDIDKLFLQSQTSNLNKSGGISYIVGKGIDVNGVPEGMIETRQTKGLSEQERNKLYHPTSPYARQLAESQLQSMPELLDVTGGDKEKALQAIINRNWSTSGSYKQDINYGSTGDPSYTKPEKTDEFNWANLPGRALPQINVDGTNSQDIEKEVLLQKLNNPEEYLEDVGTVSTKNENFVEGFKKALVPNMITSLFLETKELFTGKPERKEYYKNLEDKIRNVSNNITPEQVRNNALEEINLLKKDPDYKILYENIKDKYPQRRPGDPSYKELETKINSEFITKAAEINESLRASLVYVRSFSPEELPMLYDDIFKPNEDLEIPLYEVVDGKRSEDKFKISEFSSKEKKLLETSSLTINPVKGVMEITIGDKLYEVGSDNIDVAAAAKLEELKEANKGYFNLLKTGIDPKTDPRVATYREYIENNSAALYMYLNRKYTKVPPKK